MTGKLEERVKKSLPEGNGNYGEVVGEGEEEST